MESTQEQSARVGGHRWWLMAFCLLPIAAVVAIGVFNVSVSNVLIFGMILLCPLSHILMMRGHGHGGGHGQAAGGASCHQDQQSTKQTSVQ